MELNSPTYDKVGNNKNTGKIIPIYPLTNSLTQNSLRSIIENGIKLVNGVLPEVIPEYLINECKLMDINTATKQIHFPVDFENFNKARKRLVFDELYLCN